MPPRLRLLLGALLVLACARAAAPVTKPSASAAECCADAGHRIATQYRVGAIATRRFTHAQLWAALDPIVAASNGALRVRDVGRSIQGRAIRAITFGTGRTTVLLWSQMHGDESTATMALADLLAWMADPAASDPLRQRLASALTVVLVPMLNPDGTELFQRENAIGIDVNRDARRLSTPEARTLVALRDSIRPAYGFNLHDQNARTLVGAGGRQVAIALLAPAADSSNDYGPTRADARLLAAHVATVLRGEIPGRVAKYDDAFEPRAFGDLSQRAGVRTILIESGAYPGDPEKQRLRAVNVVAILSALDAIATGRHLRSDPSAYEALPTNARATADLFVRGGSVVLPGVAPMRVDVTIAYDEPVARLRPRIRDVGDLLGVVALDTIDATGLFIHPAPGALVDRDGARWLRLGAPAQLTLRRGPDPTSAVVRELGSP